MAKVELRRRDGRTSSEDGTDLFWQSWEVASPRATFAVLHGLGEHSGRYDEFATAMADRGYSTFAIDLRGMGRSAGPRGVVKRWSEWEEDAQALFKIAGGAAGGGDVIPLGHSFGGVLMLSCILHDRIRPRRFVLSNPGLRTKAKVPGWKTALGKLTSSLVPGLTLSNEVNPATVSRRPDVVEAYRVDPLTTDKISSRLYTEWQATAAEIFARAAEIRVPFLLIVGDADRLIDPDGSRELDRLATGTPHRMRVYPGRYHEPFNDLDNAEVFDDIAAWAAEPAN